MATAKQIAARKLFVARVRAGEFNKSREKSRKQRIIAAENRGDFETAQKLKFLSAHRLTKKPSKKKAITRPSQITKAKPTKRLVARRKMSAKKGYFPNPNPVKRPNMVEYGEFKVMYAKNHRFIAIFQKRAEAVEYAKAIAEKSGKQIAIERV